MAVAIAVARAVLAAAIEAAGPAVVADAVLLPPQRLGLVPSMPTTCYTTGEGLGSYSLWQLCNLKQTIPCLF